MALLKKLRNTTDFCSDECRQKYQDESNQMAVSRLMQQRKPKAAKVVAVRSDNRQSGGGTMTAVAEPPMAEYLYQSEMAALAAAPVSSSVEWSVRKSTQLLPTLSDDTLSSILALEFAHISDAHTPRGPRVALIEDLLHMQSPSLLALRLEPQVLPNFQPNFATSGDVRWPDLWLQILQIATDEAAVADETPVAEAPAPTPVVSAPAPAVSHVEPALIPAIKAIKPEVVHASTEATVINEPVSIPVMGVQMPAPTMLPLRPRIVIAPKEQAKAPAPELKRAAPTPAPTPAPKPVELKSAPAPAAKTPEVKNPEIKLEARRTPAKVEPAKPEIKLEAKAEPKNEPKNEPKAAVKSTPEIETPIAAPKFGAEPKSSASTGLWQRMPWWEKCAAVAVLFLSVGGWLINGKPSDTKKTGGSTVLASPAASAMGMGADSWSTEWATDLAGTARARQLTVYRPSRTMKDYVVDFQGTIQERSIGWVVRMKDPKNYYCLKLENDRPGAVKLVRFAVIDGKEDTHTQLPLSMLPASPAGSYKIRVEAKGPKISTYVNGQAVDVWVDQRIAQGAAGFSNERGERAVVKTVQVSF